MDYDNILDCSERKEFYEWLKENHNSEKECWVDCKRGKIRDDEIFYYIDAMYVALCFGWIDSVHKNINGRRLQRFTPRKANSPWGELNKERCRYLIRHGLMSEARYEILPDLDEEFIIAQDILNRLKSDEEIWENFKNFPELYKKIRIANIKRKRKKKDVFERMLTNFLEKTKANKMYGNWNDYGRLAP